MFLLEDRYDMSQFVKKKKNHEIQFNSLKLLIHNE